MLFIVSCTFLLLVILGASSANNSTDQIYKINHGKKMLGQVLDTSTVKRPLACSKACLARSCQGFNVVTMSDATLECQLIADPHETNLTDDAQSNYYSECL